MSSPVWQIPPGVVSLADYEAAARERLDDSAWAYLAGAAADGVTAAENLAAYARLRLHGRVLAEFPNGGHTRIKLLGREHAHPILLAPVAYHRLAHPDGERASALGAAAAEATFVVSTQASMSVEEIAATAPGAPRWFQLYIQPDRELTAELAHRAEAAGCEALVLTADAPVAGLRNAEQRAGFRLPKGVSAVHLAGRVPKVEPAAPQGALCGGLMAGAPVWADLERLCATTRLPVLVKGITHPDDARRALAAGARGIVVSNHGGRGLDTLPASIELLPVIAAAVAGRAPVLVDGGIRRGTDVLKALASGATAVLIGRPYVFGLAVAGASGVAHVVRILRAELEVAMALTGCPTVDHIGPSVLWRG
jgi:4-hydroxymandelate oxidase